MELPQAIILSTQRSGTHLLESFLKKHPQVNGMGEMYLRYRRHGELSTNVAGKVNIAILMYSEMPIFLKLYEEDHAELDCKIIHLLRDPQNIALSRAQMEADKKQAGAAYQAHYHKSDLETVNSNSVPKARGIANLADLPQRVKEIVEEQQLYIDLLKPVEHLQLYYEEFVKDDQNVEELDEQVQKKLFSFLGLQDTGGRLFTTYIKTGMANS